MRFAAAAALVMACSLAAPADAQIVGRRDYGPAGSASPFLPDGRLPGPGIAQDVGAIRERIGQARENGTLSRREARQLDREARLISALARRYGRDGFSMSEHAELQSRALALRSAVVRPASTLPRRRR